MLFSCLLRPFQWYYLVMSGKPFELVSGEIRCSAGAGGGIKIITKSVTNLYTFLSGNQLYDCCDHRSNLYKDQVFWAKALDED